MQLSPPLDNPYSQSRDHQGPNFLIQCELWSSKPSTAPLSFKIPGGSRHTAMLPWYPSLAPVWPVRNTYLFRSCLLLVMGSISSPPIYMTVSCRCREFFIARITDAHPGELCTNGEARKTIHDSITHLDHCHCWHFGMTLPCFHYLQWSPSQ